MLQNKIHFNQSSVRLEIVGLPDYSNNENDDQISIISQWKLMIIDKPLIEGNIDHLSSIIDAFYSYSNFLINNKSAFYESNLIDIKAEDLFTHCVLLKSSKPNVEPLKIKIGNSVLADIINCFDQFYTSNKVRQLNQITIKSVPKESLFNAINKDKILSLLVTPLLSIFSIIIVSSTFIFYYDFEERKENISFINLKRNIQ